MNGKFYLLTTLAAGFCVAQVGCIVSKPSLKKPLEKSDAKEQDTVGAQSIDRDYISGYEEGYGHGSHGGHGGHGLGAHGIYGFPESYGSYDVHEDVKHHGHHVEDYHHHHHHHDHHKHQDYHKSLAIKGLLVPLAGVALLGAAAAFVSNPILLQLGVISGSTLGRRKREIKETAISPEDQIRLNEIKLLERFMAQVPKHEIRNQERKMLARYLSCFEGNTVNFCLERLACELHSPEGKSMPMEANVLTIVVSEIMENDFIPDGTKMSISQAIERGKRKLSCGVYKCDQLETPGKNFQ